MKTLLKITFVLLFILVLQPVFSACADSVSAASGSPAVAFGDPAAAFADADAATPDDSAAISGNPDAAPANPTPVAIGGLRGIWVATVVNMDYPSKPAADPEVLKTEALKILDYAANEGFNAVFLQVRPTADALYKSAIFPWSKYLAGKQGTAPDGDFDPLEFWVAEAHKRGIQLHAWINPYRITKRVTGDPKYDFSSLDPSNPARLHPEWVVRYSDGNLYFDPGIPEVRKLIIDSVLEIINNYGIDGIHLDDYFYPGADFNDKATFQKYGAGYASIDDWRRANTYALVSDMSKAVRSAGKNVRFGVSPFGIWENKGSDPSGSDTKGLESYKEYYSDSRQWVKDGLLDYIAPQIYWNIGFSAADYSKLVSWWKDTVSGTGVDLYIGQAAYRSADPDPSSPWYGVSEIEKQMKLNESIPEIKGSIFFNYSALLSNPSLGAVIKAVYQKEDGIVPVVPASVSRPIENIRTSFDQFYLNGASDPSKPLYLNGTPISNRSRKGYFGVLVPLAPGENIFTVSQDASFSTRVIYRTVSSTAPVKMSSSSIPKSSAWPQSQEYRMAGEKITLSCQAPSGSKMTVRLGGKTYTMKSSPGSSGSSTSSKSSTPYAATFTYTYTIPSYSGTPRNINLGSPVYTMNYRGTVKTCTAPAAVGVIMKNSPFLAEVQNPVMDTYNSPASGNGMAYELYKGMTDYVTGMTNGYVRLSCGQWVKAGNVRTYISKSRFSPSVKKAVYITGNKWDIIMFDVLSPAAALASFSGTALMFDISGAVTAVSPKLPDDSLFSSVSVRTGGGKASYILTLKEGLGIDGYYIEKTASGLSLHIKRHTTSDSANGPLSGITIMVDPGHGGDETGTTGPLGLTYPEKMINLNTAMKLKTELERLGASVLMTRTSDKTLSLTDRLALSRNARPDLFISVHADSAEDNVDMTVKSGFSIHYRDPQAQLLANNIHDNLAKDMDINDRGIDTNNFYVLRGTWCPSVLVETGFVPNPDEFEKLIDDTEQARIAASLAEAISRYFAG